MGNLFQIVMQKSVERVTFPCIVNFIGGVSLSAGNIKRAACALIFDIKLFSCHNQGNKLNFTRKYQMIFD